MSGMFNLADFVGDQVRVTMGKNDASIEKIIRIDGERRGKLRFIGQLGIVRSGRTNGDGEIEFAVQMHDGEIIQVAARHVRVTERAQAPVASQGVDTSQVVQLIEYKLDDAQSKTVWVNGCRALKILHPETHYKENQWNDQ